MINQKGCEVLGVSADAIIGKDWFDTYVPENVRQNVIRGFRQLMAGDTEPVEYFENPVSTQSGEERLIAWQNVLLRDEAGKIVGTLSSGEDITERKHIEEQIRKLNQDLRDRAVALEAANKELEAFACSISHDLRAPLRHIDGFMELLADYTTDSVDEKSRSYMNDISVAAKRMGSLIDDLLAFSRMGRKEMLTRQFDFGILVKEVIQELERDFAGRTIHWNIHDLPLVTGDRSLLHTVMFNLISNAIKFTRPMKNTRIEIGYQTRNSETVIFVRDNGVGFDQKYANKLFGVFQRLHRIDEFEGTGIGLANVQRIIRRHGGRTWAEGKINQGATFYFSLP